MSVNIQVENHFITPIVVANFSAMEPLNQQLSQLFLSYENKPEQYKNKNKFNTNIGKLFDSPFNLFDSNEPAIKQIKKIFEDSLRGWIQQSSGMDINKVMAMTLENHSWFHVTREGGQKTLHNHPNASWSMVYYVDGGDEDLENRSGVIQFYDPRGSAGMYQDPANMHLKREYNFNGVGYLPKAGMLLIFPSYLYHEVLPYRGKRPRINIAANYWVKS